MPRIAEDVTGQKFNNLTALYKQDGKWVCQCICGNITSVNLTRLKNGRIKSCGCLQFQSRSEDISGKRFGRLTVLRKDKCNNQKYLCQCDCGNVTSVYKDNLIRGLTQSCGCLHSDLVSDKLTIDLTGQKFGRLLVLQRDFNKLRSQGVYWKCLCDCGNIISVIAHSLKEGNTQSCGCLKQETTSELLALHLEGQRFGRLTVIQRCENIISADNAQYSQWLCQCDCGNTIKVKGHYLVSGGTSSCGCLISKGEEIVRKILISKNINFEVQYTFNDLRSKKNYPLKFDFAIFDNSVLKCLIEYQGEQHFDDYNHGEFGKQQREVTDIQKREYCKNNNIKLFEIKYNENINDRVDDILTQI